MLAPVQVPPGAARKGMLADICETPAALQRLLDAHVRDGAVELPTLTTPLPSGRLGGVTPLQAMAACAPAAGGAYSRKISIVGCGTSWHVALLAEYLIETIARIPVEVNLSSEFRCRQRPLLRAGDAVVFVSSSGETHDTLESLRLLRANPELAEVLALGVGNEPESSLARESDAFLEVLAGPEVGVASTKTFSSCALAFTLLAVALAEENGLMQGEERQTFMQRLKELPSAVQDVLDRECGPFKSEVVGDGEKRLHALSIGECALWDIGCQNVLADNFIFLGRGFNFPAALEGAMKLKEIAYIHAEGYPAAEMKHGPIALIDRFMPVVFIAPRSDPTYEKIKSNIEEVKTRNGSVIAITEHSNDELGSICEYVIRVPTTHEFLMPLLSVIPLQLLAFFMGVLRGNEVDQPRGLLKTHTQDRKRTIDQVVGVNGGKATLDGAPAPAA